LHVFFVYFNIEKRKRIFNEGGSISHKFNSVWDKKLCWINEPYKESFIPFAYANI